MKTNSVSGNFQEILEWFELIPQTRLLLLLKIAVFWIITNTKVYATKNALKYFQITLIMEGGRLVSEFTWVIIAQQAHIKIF